MLPKYAEDLIKSLPPNQRDIAAAIIAATAQESDMQSLDSMFQHIQQNRFSPFDVIYVDLSINRASSPLELSGAGTFIFGAESTDNSSTCSISYENPDEDSNRRLTIVRGKGFNLPFTKVYLYHAAQSGKYLKLLRGTSLPSFLFGMVDYSGIDANSDLVQALGNSNTFTPSQVSVTSSSTTIIAANASRKRLTLVNIDTAATVYINAGVATTAHFPLLPGAYITLNTTAQVRGITAAGTVVVGVLEE